MVCFGTRSRSSCSADRGQALPLLLVAVVFVALAAVAVAGFSTAIVSRDRAQAAADATALAFTIGGEQAARAVAGANGATLLSVVVDHRPPASVRVRVRVGDQVATARATNAP